MQKRDAMERIFPGDQLSKRERVERTLRHQPVDRAALHDQLSYNPQVIADWTGRHIDGFAYTLEDIGLTIRRTLDMCFPPTAPCGTDRVVTADGFTYQHDNWTTWHVSRPFTDVEGAKRWLLGRIDALRTASFDADAAREAYRREMAELQRLVGETVICHFSGTGFCGIFDAMGLNCSPISTRIIRRSSAIFWNSPPPAKCGGYRQLLIRRYHQ